MRIFRKFPDFRKFCTPFCSFSGCFVIFLSIFTHFQEMSWKFVLMPDNPHRSMESLRFHQYISRFPWPASMGPVFGDRWVKGWKAGVDKAYDFSSSFLLLLFILLFPYHIKTYGGLGLIDPYATGEKIINWTTFSAPGACQQSVCHI